MSDKRIHSALISVFYKEGLDDIVRILHKLNVKIYSTGGTFNFINDLGIPAEKVDGMDVIAVHEAAKRALDRVRAGDGPQFLELETYRYRGHSMADPGSYRPAAELNAYQANDPIAAAVHVAEHPYPSPNTSIAWPPPPPSPPMCRWI